MLMSYIFTSIPTADFKEVDQMSDGRWLVHLCPRANDDTVTCAEMVVDEEPSTEQLTEWVKQIKTDLLPQRKTELVARLNDLKAIMAESDAKANKCTKLGFVFAETYPHEYQAYVKANEEYNATQYLIADIETLINNSTN